MKNSKKTGWGLPRTQEAYILRCLGWCIYHVARSESQHSLIPNLARPEDGVLNARTGIRRERQHAEGP
jgi:hypothetical protein